MCVANTLRAIPSGLLIHVCKCIVDFRLYVEGARCCYSLPFCNAYLCCSVLQCVAVCCSVLQCVAVCCTAMLLLSLSLYRVSSPSLSLCRVKTHTCSTTGWLRSVGSIKLQVSFAECSLSYRVLLRKRPIVL